MGGICKHGANAFIETYFHDCVYDSRDLLGFCLGLGSILCWLFAQLPQLIKNYREKSADALSPVFLAEWLLGDTFNLVGALLKGDQPTTIVLTAQYFICMDCILLLQYLYYTSLAKRRERAFTLVRRRERHHHHHHHHQGGQPSRARLAAVGVVAATAVVLVGRGGRGTELSREGSRVGSTSRRLLAVLTATVMEQRVGSVLGYASCLLYLSSRTFQLYKNFTRRSVKGLALSMFFCAIAANTLYGSSVLLRSRTSAERASSLPWILGSLGTVILDIAILSQGLRYGEGPEAKHSGDEEEVGLLEELEGGGEGGGPSSVHLRDV